MSEVEIFTFKRIVNTHTHTYTHPHSIYTQTATKLYFFVVEKTMIWSNEGHIKVVSIDIYRKINKILNHILFLFTLNDSWDIQ